MPSDLPKRPHDQIFQADMDSLASLANAKLTGSTHIPFTFASGSVSQSLWLSEMNRINSAFWEVIQNSGSTYGFTLKSSGVMESNMAPAFWPDGFKTVSGPWIVSPNSSLVEQNGWSFDNVSLYLAGNYSTTLKTAASRNGHVSMDDVNNNADPQKYKIQFRVGGSQSASLSFNGVGGTSGQGILFKAGYIGPNPPAVPTPNPSFSMTTNIPGAVGAPVFTTFYQVVVNSASVSPGLYNIEVTVATDGLWAIDQTNGANGVIGDNNTINSIYLSVTNGTQSIVKGISTNDDLTVRKIDAPSVANNGGWPFGVFYTQKATLGGTGATFVDVVDGHVFTPSLFTPALLVNRTSPRWDAINAPASQSFVWAATTVGTVKENAEIDDRLPFSRIGANLSSMRTASVFNGTIINPVIGYGLAQWPATSYSASGLTFANAYGCCVTEIIAHKTPQDIYGNGILVAPPEAETVEIGYFAGSTFKSLEVITIPASASAYSGSRFWPCFTGTPIVTRKSGSLSASFAAVDLFCNSMLGYTRAQGGVSSGQNLLVPWLSGIQYPISHVHYNDCWNRLTAMSASV